MRLSKYQFHLGEFEKTIIFGNTESMASKPNNSDWFPILYSTQNQIYQQLRKLKSKVGITVSELSKAKSNYIFCSFQDSDSVKLVVSPTKNKKSNHSKKHKKQVAGDENLKPPKAISDVDDDEVETSLSDELNHSWPSKTPSKLKKANMNSRTLARRKRERKKDRSEGISSGDEETR